MGLVGWRIYIGLKRFLGTTAQPARSGGSLPRYSSERPVDAVTLERMRQEREADNDLPRYEPKTEMDEEASVGVIAPGVPNDNSRV